MINVYSDIKVQMFSSTARLFVHILNSGGSRICQNGRGGPWRARA